MQTENEKSTTNVAIATVDVAAPAAAPAPTAAASSEVEIEGQPEGAAPAPHHVYIFKRLRREMPPPTKKRIHMVLAGMMVSMVLIGWTEGSVGPLFPALQKHFGINYLLMSLIYATSFAGSLIAGLFNVWITDRIGFGLATPLGAIFTMVSYMLMGTGAHYALFLVAFALTGFGMSLQDAQVNNLCSRLPDAGNKMMFVQACFGLGGTLAPLAATAFAEHVEKEAYRYFFVAMGVAFIALLFMILAFDGCTEEQIENWRQAEWATDKDKGIKDDKDKDDKSSENTTEKKRAVEGEVEIAQMPDVTIIDRDGTVPPLVPAAEPKVPQTSGQKMKRIFKTPAVYALMGFSFLYIGVEVAISGWSVTFLRKERGGTAAAGYVSTGFWGGMTLGRIVLIPVTNRLGYQVSIYLYSVLSLALEVIIWTTKSLVGNAVCYSFVGFFLGPIYPVALMVIAEVLDEDLRGGIMGIMGSMGGAGAALVPFVAGAISDRYGIWTIQPVSVALIGAFVLLWAAVPTKRKPPS